jgi:hypothetical protein
MGLFDFFRKKKSTEDMGSASTSGASFVDDERDSDNSDVNSDSADDGGGDWGRGRRRRRGLTFSSFYPN